MKKLFAILVIAASFTACNNSGEEKSGSVTDSIKPAESPLMDAVNAADSAGKVMEAGKDSVVKAVENAKEIIKP